MPPLPILVVTQWCFMFAITVKTLSYGISVYRIITHIGTKKIKDFFKRYLKAEHLLHSAWRLGSYIALFVGYIYLQVESAEIDDISVVQVWQTEKVLVSVWAILMIFLVVRALIQGIVDIKEIDDIAKALRKIIKTKIILRRVSLATSVIGFASPLVGLKWLAAAQLGRKMVITGQVVGLFESWFDKRVDSHFRQYVATLLLSAVLESGYKILVIGLSIYMVS
ncbi:MAG: hypothetical protein CMP10_03455 [Zetaproteobacteria bacterium]|mgnify:CR=1 FL=1|nr:hypothetical protein [Pseudobdellovibrionaceae bacterium]